MRIEEIIKSCAHHAVAAAAVSCMGPRFYRDVSDVAERYGMSLGAYTAFSVERFADRGDEQEMRSVRAAMADAPEPVLAGLYRILSIALAAGVPAPGRQFVKGPPPFVAGPHIWDREMRREWIP